MHSCRQIQAGIFCPELWSSKYDQQHKSGCPHTLIGRPGRPHTLIGRPKFRLNSMVFLIRVPTAQGKQGKWPKKSLSWKTQAIWKFCQNIGKTQGILFAQAVNSLILKVNDIAIHVFAAKISIFF